MFIVRPLKQTGLSFTIVVDALDECEDKEPVSAFLSALARYIDEVPTIKFFITGRPEDHIRSGFMKLGTKELPLHDVESATVDSDIKSYLKTELQDIAARRIPHIHGSWPSDKDITTILDKCSGLFIIASAITRFIDYPYATPHDRLDLLLDMPNSTIYEGKSGIDVMYHQILIASFKNVAEDDSEFFDQMHLVVGSIVLAFTPLSTASLAKILQTSPDRIRNIVSHLHSVLIVPNSDSDPVRMCHKSFADFITELQRCRDSRHFINASFHHVKLGALCLELMNTTLIKNICHLPRYVMNDDVKDLPARREKYIGVSLAYACSSWAKHLQSSFGYGADIGDITASVNYFLEHRFLPWLEVSSVEGKFYIAVYALHDVRSWLANAKSLASIPLALIDDCERFVLKFFDIMEQSAMHIYHSALPWSPASSTIRRLYQNGLIMEAKLLNAVDDAWSACIREISVNVNRIIRFSHTGALIAVDTANGVAVLDALTGVTRANFGAPEIVYSIDFSPDDSLLMSALLNQDIYVWDLQTGNIVQTFTDAGYVAAFSPCGTKIASGYGRIIRIWSMSSGRCIYVLEDHSSYVLAVCWSATGNQLISGSVDGTVQVSEVSEGTYSKLESGYIGPVTAVASKSHGSFLVASASKDKIVKVYDLRSGDVIQTFSSDHDIKSVQFSIDGEKIMYATDNLGYIRDLARKTLVSTIRYDGHLAAFSRDGTCIASSSGTRLKIWKRSERGHEHEAHIHHNPNILVNGLSFLADGHLVVTITANMMIKVWDATIGTSLSVFNVAIGKNRFYRSDRSSLVFSANSMFIACLSGLIFDEGTVWVWNVHTRSFVKSINVGRDARRIAVASDGGRLASVSTYNITIWDLAIEKSIARLENTYPDPFQLRVAFAADGNTVFINNRNIVDYWCMSPALSPNAFELPMILIHIPSWSCRDQPRSYHYRGKWIFSQDGKHMLCLPPDKEAQMTDSHGDRIATVPRDGKWYIVDFSNVSLSW